MPLKRTPSQIEASRRNGAKSRGPSSPDGKARSAQNALKHGAYAQPQLLLSIENSSKFQELQESLFHQFQPVGELEISLVEEMALCRWRMRRFWFVQDATMEIELARQKEEVEETFSSITEPARLALAVAELVDNSRSLDFLYRTESRLRRQFSRALKELLHLQDRRKQPPVPNSPRPRIKNDETNPASPQTPSSQPLPLEPSAHFRLKHPSPLALPGNFTAGGDAF